MLSSRTTMAVVLSSTTSTDLTLSAPTPSDLHALSILQSAAFPEQPFANNYARYQRYHKECPAKLEHCRIVKLSNEVVVAACQLQLRAKNGGAFDVIIEWIGCHPDHRGKGVGAMLLDWAGNFAHEALGVTKLGLYMIKSNTDARRLYERHGFAAVGGSHTANKRQQRFRRNLDRWFGHWSVLRMEKNLS